MSGLIYLCACSVGSTAASFRGSSYLRYRVKIFRQPSRSLSMAFKTWKSTGTLVYAAGDYDYSILEVGQLQHMMQSNSQLVTMGLTGWPAYSVTG